MEIRRQVERRARPAGQHGLRRDGLRHFGGGVRPHRRRHELADLAAVRVAGRDDDDGLADGCGAQGKLAAALDDLGDEDVGVVRHGGVGERVAVGVVEVRRQVQRRARGADQHGLRRDTLRHLGRGARRRRYRYRHATADGGALRIGGGDGDDGVARGDAPEGEAAAVRRHLGDEHGGVVRQRRVGERAVGIEIRRQVQRRARGAGRHGLRRQGLRRLQFGSRAHGHGDGLVGVAAIGVAGGDDDDGVAGCYAPEGEPAAARRHLGDEDVGVVRHRHVGERLAVGVTEVRRQVHRLARLAGRDALRRDALGHLGGGARLRLPRHRDRHGLADGATLGVGGRDGDGHPAGGDAVEGEAAAAARQVGDGDADVIRGRRVAERVAVGVGEVRRQVQRQARGARRYALRRDGLHDGRRGIRYGTPAATTTATASSSSVTIAIVAPIAVAVVIIVVDTVAPVTEGKRGQAGRPAAHHVAVGGGGQRRPRRAVVMQQQQGLVGGGGFQAQQVAGRQADLHRTPQGRAHPDVDPFLPGTGEGVLCCGLGGAALQRAQGKGAAVDRRGPGHGEAPVEPFRQGQLGNRVGAAVGGGELTAGRAPTGYHLLGAAAGAGPRPGRGADDAVVQGAEFKDVDRVGVVGEAGHRKAGGVGVAAPHRRPAGVPDPARVDAVPELVGRHRMIGIGQLPPQRHLPVARHRPEPRRSLRRLGMHGDGPARGGGGARPVGVLGPHREGVGGVVDQTRHGVRGFVRAAGVRITAVRNIRPHGRDAACVLRVFVAGDGAAAIAGRRRPGEGRLGVARHHAEGGRGGGQAGRDADGVRGGARIVRAVAVVVVHGADAEGVRYAVGEAGHRVADGVGGAGGDGGPGQGVLLDLVPGDAGVVRVVPGEGGLGVARFRREAGGLGRGGGLRGGGRRGGGRTDARVVLRQDCEVVGLPVGEARDDVAGEVAFNGRPAAGNLGPGVPAVRGVAPGHDEDAFARIVPGERHPAVSGCGLQARGPGRRRRRPSSY